MYYFWDINYTYKVVIYVWSLLVSLIYLSFFITSRQSHHALHALDCLNDIESATLILGAQHHSFEYFKTRKLCYIQLAQNEFPFEMQYFLSLESLGKLYNDSFLYYVKDHFRMFPYDAKATYVLLGYLMNGNKYF